MAACFPPPLLGNSDERQGQEVRAIAKSALAARICGPQREKALHSALKDSLEADDGDPMDTLPKLAPHLTASLPAFALEHEDNLPEVITVLRSRLSLSTLAALTKRAKGIDEADLRFRILWALAPRLSAERRERISTEALAALAEEGGYVRDKMVVDLASWIDESLLPRMLEAVRCDPFSLVGPEG